MEYRLIERYYLSKINRDKMPRHLAIVMDGNGRWGMKHFQSRCEGHKQGARVFEKIADFCDSIGIRYLTVYAFSSENWKRPQEEIAAIMSLLGHYLDEVKLKSEQYNVVLRFIGDHQGLDPLLLQKMNEAEMLTAEKTGIVVNIALNYGGRNEIVQAARRALALEEFQKNPEALTTERFAELLDTAGQPDPDLILKPGGEYRLSNFLLWQSAYSEFWFSKVLWPCFRPKHLLKAILAYQGRKRRFGGIS